MNPMTAEDLFARPDDGYRYELQAGLLVRQPLRVLRHGITVSRAMLALDKAAKPAGCVAVGPTPMILARDPDTVRGMHVGLYTREQWAGIDLDEPLDLIPVLAVLVGSIARPRENVQARTADFLAFGIPVVWSVDPWSKTVPGLRGAAVPCRLPGG